ncbi:hypothetical protein IMZ08_16325 [Bacillus luteolus]|uniref:Uncharacterized protein n=1 Tax=Litchfieldia luteola TaxID=682179 RepID=A0ABR9QM82_9BACI|nr:hypothetical protein [Cytobacillus luteolus]MBE4909620.1 hypothetical protein [Cytobacillus luteolus]MBP1941021.1 hypothetical protein [Cytobacillus luteolus]
MQQYFNVYRDERKIKIDKKDDQVNLMNISIFLDNQHMGHMSFIDSIIINSRNNFNHKLLIQADVMIDGYIKRIYETYDIGDLRFSERETYFRAGDILVACDNLNGLPYGYMGHSAMVVDESSIVEGVVTNPIIRKVPVENFFNNHKLFAHFRPKNKEMGEKAAKYALNYLETFNENKEKGIAKPIFLFTLNTPLEDEWNYIYCSKLIWLSYYYGADYEFPNDHLWFAPEDLYTNLKDNPDFEVMYIHPDFVFYIDA